MFIHRMCREKDIEECLPCQPCRWEARQEGCAGDLDPRHRRCRRRARAGAPPPLAPPAKNKVIVDKQIRVNTNTKIGSGAGLSKN